MERVTDDDDRTNGTQEPRVATEDEQNLCKVEPTFLKVLAYHGGSLDVSAFCKEPYVALLCAIVGQRLRFSHARKIRARLLNILDLAPERVLCIGQNHLASILGHRSKAETIIHVTEHIVDENIKLDSPESMRSLEVLKGIGKWTIQTATLTAWPSADVFPISDSFLRGRIQKLLDLSEGPSEAEVTRIIQRWAPHRGTACWLLWRWFEDTPYENPSKEMSRL